MATVRSQLRAEEYRVRAKAATAAAEASPLESTRRQHELAAVRWTELAEEEERRGTAGAGVRSS